MSFLPIYIRLVAYAIVLAVSITHLINNSSNRYVALGNIITAILLAVAAMYTDILGRNSLLIRNSIVTPASLIWAFFNLLSLFKIKKEVIN